MKLREKDPWSPGTARAFNIRQAVESACDPGPYDYTDSLDKAAKHASNASEMLARLIERLHEEGNLSDEGVCTVLGSGWEKAR